MKHQAPVTGRVVRPEAEHGDRRALGERRAHPHQRLRPDQRRVAEDDEDVVRRTCERGLRGQHRMRGSQPLGLDEDLRSREHAPGLRRHRVGIRPHHHRRLGTARRQHRIEHMAEQRSAAEDMQHLRPCREHAGALAGREHDGEAAAFTRQRIPPGCVLRVGAVISDSIAGKRRECAPRALPAPRRGCEFEREIVGTGRSRHSAVCMQAPLFLPSARQASWLLIVGFLVARPGTLSALSRRSSMRRYRWRARAASIPGCAPPSG